MLSDPDLAGDLPRRHRRRPLAPRTSEERSDLRIGELEAAAVQRLDPIAGVALGRCSVEPIAKAIHHHVELGATSPVPPTTSTVRARSSTPMVSSGVWTTGSVQPVRRCQDHEPGSVLGPTGGPSYRRPRRRDRQSDRIGCDLVRGPLRRPCTRSEPITKSTRAGRFRLTRSASSRARDRHHARKIGHRTRP